jgi:hypothetical protein
VWRLEIEKLSLIHAAIEKEKSRVEEELTSRGFFAVKLWEAHLYLVYLRDREPGPYALSEPCLWSRQDRASLLAVLALAARHPAAQAVYVRGLLAGKDRAGSLVFPLGRFDLPLARRLATPLPAKHPALIGKKKKKSPPPVIFYEEIEE